ncbi:MAG: ABC transporter substrate-binding protein [Candidatus Rokuibacteriota bacterium]
MRQPRFARFRTWPHTMTVLVFAVFAVAALWPGTVRGQSREETLVIARDIDDVVTNDPSRTFEWTSQIPTHAAYDTLLSIEPPDIAHIRPKLATKWEISPDGTTYTFQLRPGVKFSSGNPLTAHDVKFSLLRLKHMKDNPSFLVGDVKEIVVVNDTTVKIVLTAPNASFLGIMAGGVTTGVIDSKTVKAHGGTDAENAKDVDKATEWLNQNSVGSGPYVLKGWTKNVELVMERNPHYWGPRPRFARIVFRHVKSGSTQREMLERGDVDVAMDLDPDLAAKVKGSPKIKVVEGLTSNQIYMGLNVSKEISRELADKRVRQAIAYAIDYDGIIQGLMRGAADRPPGMIPLGLLGVDKAMNRKQDVAKAKALLKEAGLSGGFGVRFTYYEGLLGAPAEAIAAKIQSDLAAVGVRATLDRKERTVAWSEYRASKSVMILSGWSPDYLDPDPYADAYYKAGGVVPKRVNWENSRATELTLMARKEQDPKKRAALYREIQQIGLDEVPHIMLLQPKNFVGVHPAIKGYAIHPIWFVGLEHLSR